MKCRVRDLDVFYEEIGEGLPLVVIHGWTLDHHCEMMRFEPFLGQRGSWRRLYFDLPGMGQTPSAPWIKTHGHMMDVVCEFIETVLPDNQRFALSGASYGGYIARGVLQRMPTRVAGLLLLVPVIRNPREERDLPAHRPIVINESLTDSLEGDEAWIMKNMVVVQSPAILNALRDVLKVTLPSDTEFLSQLRGSPDVDQSLKTFEAPTLILCGRQDAVCGYRDAWQLFEKYPRATFAVLDRAGHGLGDEQTKVMSVLIDEWFDRVEEYVRMTSE